MRSRRYRQCRLAVVVVWYRSCHGAATEEQQQNGGEPSLSRAISPILR